jgi:hypothetical protein
VETSLHRALKQRYGPAAGGREEVTLEGFRIDAVDADGVLVEVQSGPLGPLKAKLSRLLPAHRVCVVKPVVVSRRLIRRPRSGGAELPPRMSPRRGTLVDVFDDFVGLAAVFPHPNLRVELVAVAIDEHRQLRRRRPGYKVIDRRLNAVLSSCSLRQGRDLLSLLPDDLPDPFTTADLSARLRRSLTFAQRVAYCLRVAAAVAVVGKQANRLIYSFATADSVAGG